MKTTKTQESPSKIRLTIEATAEEVEPALDRAFKALAHEVKIPGFRPGKAPRRILEARLDQSAVREAALQEALPMLVAQAVQEEDLAPVAPPSVDVSHYDVGGTLTFDATIEVRPEFALPDFSSIVVTRPPSEATDEEVAEQVERMRERFATLQTVERPASSGDFALIDLTSTAGETKVEEASATDLLYEVGSGGFVPELDAEVTGKKSGDILRFETTLPEGVESEWAGTPVTVSVLVKEIREKVLPGLDDEFAKSASEFDTLDELRAELRKHIGEAKAQQADMEMRANAIEQLVEGTDLEPPESLVAEELRYRAGRFAERLRSAGMTLEAYLEASGETEENVESDLRQQAERSVRAQLVLDEVARREEIKLEGEELAEEVRKYAENLSEDPEKLGKELEQSGRLAVLAGDIIRRKALELVVERAEIREAEQQES